MHPKVEAIRRFLAGSDKIRHEGARKIMLDAFDATNFSGLTEGEIVSRATDVIAQAVYEAKLGPGTLEQLKQVAEVYVRTADDPRFASVKH